MVNDHQKSNVKPMMFALLLGGFIAFLSETLLNVALRDLMGEMHVSPTTVQWLTTGYMLVIGILVPITAFLVQWFTSRQLYLTALIVFTIGVLVAGLAPNFSILLFGRLIQAIGTGLIIPVMMNTILVIIPIEKRGSAMGMIVMVMMIAPATGPSLSGLILEQLNWRWLFFITLPFLILAIVLVSMYMKNTMELKKPKIDLLSILLSTIGFGGVLFGFSKIGESTGGLDSAVILPLLIGVLGIILFVWRQLILDEPMLDVRTFKYPMFTAGLLLVIIGMMTYFASMLLLPMYMQGVLGLSSFIAGLALLPGGVINGLMSPITGKLFDRFGPKLLVIFGFIIMLTTFWFLSHLSLYSGIVMVVILYSCLMIGLSMVFMPAQTNGMNQLPPQYYPHGTAIMGTLQQIGGAIGTSLFVSLMTAGQSDFLGKTKQPDDPNQKIMALSNGIEYAFTVAFIILAIGILISLFLKKAHAPLFSGNQRKEG
ncbi:MDR family MFS transporter [Bacillus sp. 03113]|uniref:MDR family MFS transporter n=1 Tax=Bacillus sp. 03113 TaxID=2578211 RepID=UPI001141DBE5|nr:MDR family MFS transporter [Bacillus sp. 03113]